jgi:hypothetical protein
MVRYTMVFLSSKRVSFKGLLRLRLLFSIAVRKLDPAPSAPMTKEETSNISGTLFLEALASGVD